MAPQRVAGGSLSSSQWSARGDAQSDALPDASSVASNSQQTTSTNPECVQTEITVKYNIIKAYLAREKAPEEVRDCLEAVFNAATQRDKLPTYRQAIYDLQQSIQKLNCRIDTLPSTNSSGTSLRSYADAARKGAGGPPASLQRGHSQSAGSDWSEQAVPARHKREIIVVRGEETAAQKQRTGKELAEQKPQLIQCLQLKSSNCMMAYRKQKAQCLYRSGLAALGYENISTAGESLALQQPSAPAVEGKKPQDI
jgi:hypothetical protein